jgi:hypothetical protein
MKKVVLYVVTIALALFVSDLLCSYFLFYFFQIRGFDKPDFTYARDGRLPSIVLATKTYREIARRLGAGIGSAHTAAQECTPHAEPSPLYHHLEDYGYGYLPGRYEITFCPTPKSSTKQYKWAMNIDDDLGRRTASTNIGNASKLVIFGGSRVFGWGLNDEQTMEWLLQDHYRDNRLVKNYTHSGGGTIHSLIKFRLIRHQLTTDDIVLIGYGPYALDRNTAAPSRIGTEATYIERKWGKGTDLMHPRGRLINGKVAIDYVPLSCDTPDQYCQQSDPPLQDAYDLTVAAIDEIRNGTPAKVAIMFEDGPDDDPVMARLKAAGFPIIDLRVNLSEFFVADDISGYDGHPGPMGHYYWYGLVKQFVDRSAGSALGAR